MGSRLLPEERELQKRLAAQDAQIHKVLEAESRYEQDKDMVALIGFWEEIWASGGLLFNGVKWTFRLPDLYIKQRRYDDALRIIKKVKNPTYQYKVVEYVNKIQKLKQKARN